MNYVEETECRVCGGGLTTIFDLGELFISDFITKEETGRKAPHVLAECNQCGLVQLKHTINLDSMYRRYWYRSGLNRSMCDDLRNIVEAVESKLGVLPNGSTVVDIGCNDGTMFDFYTNKDLVKVGYDPANNLAESALQHCNFFINDYFTTKDYTFEKAKAVTSIAMFYDLPDPNKFVEDVKSILDDNGIWIIQFTDLYSMLKINAVDNICGEHLEYYKLSDLESLMNKHGLVIFDCEYNKVNGGSLRVYIKHDYAPYQLTTRYLEASDKEKEYFRSADQLELFKRRITEISKKILYYINLLKENNMEIYGLAASTKANTLLQVLGLSGNEINAIGEVNKDKFGLITSGSRIPIISEKELFEYKPNLIIILAWHFVETFEKVTKKFVEDGGYVLYPLPLPYVVSKDGNFYL